jgi:hypothetical protein
MSPPRVPPPPTKYGPAAVQTARAAPAGARVVPPPGTSHRMPLPGAVAAGPPRPVQRPVWRPPSPFDGRPPATAQPAGAPSPRLQAKRPPLPGTRVVQRASTAASMDLAEDAKYPKKPPRGRSLSFYQAGFEYYSSEDYDGDAADAYEQMAIDSGGKSIGQTFGSGESDNYDESYVEIPDEARPSAPATLWKLVYGGLGPKPGDASIHHVACAELGDGYVEVDAKTKVEAGTSKRPPMCHKVAFNHIKWAVAWLHANKTHVLALGYKGPPVSEFTWDAWRALVWDGTNLQPGHAKCNSKTASAARGEPSTAADRRKAVVYTAAKLKALAPTWFA